MNIYIGYVDLDVAMRFFSLFISKPSKYMSVEYPDGKIEDVIIKPMKKYRIKDNKKIFILVDRTTACASESFISALKACQEIVQL